MTAEDTQGLLERRAIALARPLEEASAAVASTEVLIVSVAGGRRYAVESRYVAQLVRNEGLRRLPATGSELLGLVLAKGETVPVADLGSVLGLTGADPNRPLVVVLGGADSPLGLLVDEAVSTQPLTESELRVADGPDPDTLERGVLADGAVLLDAGALLADDRLQLHISAHRAATAPPSS